MIKKVLAFIGIIAIAVMNLIGCAQPVSTHEEDKIQVVCTTYPLYDWVATLLGDQQENVELTLLMDNGADLHSYQPSAKDMIKIKNSDMVVYVGGPSEMWLDKALQESDNKNQKIVRLFDVLADSIKEEEIIEGMEEVEHEHTHEEDEHAHEEDEHAHQDEVEYDEHVWLSLRNAQVACEAITKALEAVDSENKTRYVENLESYTTQLQELDLDYKETVTTAKRQTILVGDRFPFRYLVEDYNLDYYAAFIGCSAETEASFETVTFLADKINTLELPVILVLESSDQSLAMTISENTEKQNQSILCLDSMQSVNTKDIEAGTSYLEIMSNNLKTLKQALN